MHSTVIMNVLLNAVLEQPFLPKLTIKVYRQIPYETFDHKHVLNIIIQYNYVMYLL